MTNDFSKGEMGKNILIQAIPLTIAQLVQILYNIVDRIYVGHLSGAGSMALTGIGLTFPVITLIGAFTCLFGMGGAPLCSIARGAGDNEQAEKIMGNSASLLFWSSFLIMAFCYIFKRPILYLFGASDNTYGYANTYLSIYLIGTVFSMIGTGMNFFINSQGFAKIGMSTTILGAVLNIILDPIFIFYFDMGIAGAAIATVISQAASAVWVMMFLTGKKAILKLKRENLRLDKEIVTKMIGLGLSGFIMQATNCLVQIVCNITLKSYGGDLYIGIMTILNSVREVLGLPISGITNGAQPVLGYNYGAKQYKRVRKGIVFTTLIGAAYALFAWIIVMLLPEILIKMFSHDSEMIRYGSEAMRIYFFGFIFMIFQFSGQSTFVALGESKFAIFFSILRKAIIVVPLAIFLPRIAGLGAHGVFLAEPISNLVGGLACFVTMMCTVWRRLGKKAISSL